MNATSENTDTRRDIDRWLGNYSEDHRNPANILIHLVCVPLIVWSGMALLWVVPVPPALGRPGFWTGIALFAVLVFYLRLSRMLCLSMFVAFVMFGMVTEALYRALGPALLAWVAIGVFAGAWVAQFVGHRIEGKRPSFLTDLAYLLIGPAWIMVKVLRRFRLEP
jgi:uncharacterized membrane protein YGL010W